MTNTLGDLAQSFMLQQRGSTLKTDIHRLTQELSTGQVADSKSVLAGNHSFFADMERDLQTLEAYKTATAEAQQFTGVMQSVLGDVQAGSAKLANSMLLMSSSAVAGILPQIVNDANANLDSFVSRLNTDFAGRSLFAGTATDRAPLASSEVVLDGLRTAIAGQSDLAGIMTAAQNWINDPAGFNATIYQGSDDALASFALSDTDRLSLDVRADDPALRDLLMNTGLAALVTDPTLGWSEALQKDVIAQAGSNLLAAQDSMTKIRAGVGFAESRIENITARNAAESLSLKAARNALLSADPYETATKLEEAQFQLQSLYSVTVRLSELSLLNFMR